MKHIFKFIISILIPLAVGAIAGYFTSSSVDGWFATINKPSFNPPNWVFAPVWTTLYIMMGIAFFLVWKSDSAIMTRRSAIAAYIMQLALNFLWSFVFFSAHQPGWALVNIILLWLMILETIILFRKLSTAAAWLLIPYICWVSFATVLNFAIWKLN